MTNFYSIISNFDEVNYAILSATTQRIFLHFTRTLTSKFAY